MNRMQYRMKLRKTSNYCKIMEHIQLSCLQLIMEWTDCTFRASIHKTVIDQKKLCVRNAYDLNIPPHDISNDCATNLESLKIRICGDPSVRLSSHWTSRVH